MSRYLNAFASSSGASRRLTLGIGSNVIVQIVIFIAQFALVPVMARIWGLERFGNWLMISTIPSYLALCDFGLGTAASNQMTMEVARNCRERALELFQDAFTLTSIMACAIVLVFLCIAAVVPLGSFLEAASESEVRLAVAVLALYGVVCLMFSLPNGAFKAIGLYHFSGITIALTMLLEALAAAFLVYVGANFFIVALGYLLIRSLVFGGLFLLLKRSAPWLRYRFRRPTRAAMAELVPPALAVLSFTGAQALIFQGSTLVIGIAVSTALIASFTTIRTLTRTGVQAVILDNRAVMPEFSRAWAQRSYASIKRAIISTLVLSAVVTFASGLGLILFGRWFIDVWTGGVVRVDMALLYLMTGVMILNGLWMPLAGLLIALNLQSRFSYIYAAVAAMTLLCSYFLCRSLGVDGAGIALLLMEAVMCVVILRQIGGLLRIAKFEGRR